ncbi:Short-chain dehydrogenase/reductase family 16C member 6 [Araneus ventricosus]|uniref:Short-chain dehydrogenase/reductase family 16C member 6 n=1 Tax=Araneus ventricosus TaxID=182803 RepID=A0A4Y2CN45_ARAVE|nr:Short-chain dehydrogenase/reductase family 16C member 6 [Araneus ventricosus]
MISSIKKKISLIILMAYLIPDVILGYCEDFVHFLIPRCFRRKKTITGQTVLITGAGSGVGRQLAIEFSKHSVCLVMLDVNRSSLILTEKLLNPGSRTFIYDCDVSDRERVYQVARDIKEQVGKVDILVNNEGIVSGKGLLEIPDEKIEKTMQVNSLSHFWVSFSCS